MTPRHIALGSLLSLVAFTGSAFAAGSMPAAGETPFFNDVVVASTVTRADVRAEAARQLPAAGEQASVVAQPAAVSTKSRAEVRAETRNALASGFHIAAGQNS
ncbi:MAG: hypothetical protein EPN34_13725 [Burkholderiaceae bacterium]|jgi:hypothetical protein|nr:MAG: hypothetical protein EPN34_13725 [Burkholderiaceae bacterium]